MQNKKGVSLTKTLKFSLFYNETRLHVTNYIRTYKSFNPFIFFFASNGEDHHFKNFDQRSTQWLN